MRERRKETTKGQRRRKGSWKIKGKKKKEEENHEGTAAQDEMQYSIRLQKQTDRRKRRKFQKTLPPEILCHRCYHC